MQKTNKDYPFIKNSQIIEWDIKSANTSLMRYYNLQPDNVIDKFIGMSKSEREVAVGKLMRKDKEFAKRLEESFNEIIDEFFKANQLDWDDIVSVKKDAVFVKNHYVPNTDFGPVRFIPKNTYKHVLLLPKYEIYLASDHIDVKGLPDSVLELHQDGMLYFIKELFSTTSYFETEEYFAEFVRAYKLKELEFDYYREFNSDSMFRIGGEYPMLTEAMIEDDIEYLDISYNYINVVIPTIQVASF